MVGRDAWVLGVVVALVAGLALALAGGSAEGAPGDVIAREFAVAPGASGDATLTCPAGRRLTMDRMTITPAAAEVVQLSSTASQTPETVAISVVNADAIEVAVAVSATCRTPAGGRLGAVAGGPIVRHGSALHSPPMSPPGASRHREKSRWRAFVG